MEKVLVKIYVPMLEKIYGFPHIRKLVMLFCY